MNIILILFFIFLGCVLTIIGAAILLLFCLHRAAQGSPDVNGDPERDAGISDAELRQNGFVTTVGERVVLEHGTAAIRPDFEERMPPTVSARPPINGAAKHYKGTFKI
jgi:hypothetical protein